MERQMDNELETGLGSLNERVPFGGLPYGGFPYFGVYSRQLPCALPQTDAEFQKGPYKDYKLVPKWPLWVPMLALGRVWVQGSRIPGLWFRV